MKKIRDKREKERKKAYKANTDFNGRRKLFRKRYNKLYILRKKEDDKKQE